MTKITLEQIENETRFLTKLEQLELAKRLIDRVQKQSSNKKTANG